MAWINLFIAGFFEIIWAIGLKYSNAFSKLVPSIITVIGMILSFIFLSKALKILPVGTAYAVWTGIGAIGTALLGMFLFHESHATIRILCILLIVIGIAGLRLTYS